MLEVVHGTINNSTKDTRTTTSHLTRHYVAAAHHPVAPTAAKSLSTAAVKPDEAPYVLEIAALCNAVETIDFEAVAADAEGVRRAAAAAVKKAEQLVRAASPASSGDSSEVSSSTSGTSEGSQSSSEAPFGQSWVSPEDSPLKRVTKKEPARLRSLSLMNVWVVDLPAQHTVSLFEFVRRHELHTTEGGHLKRVKRDHGSTQVSVLIKTTVKHEEEGAELAQRLAQDPQLANIMPLKPYIKAVPANHAESAEQLAQWGDIWPISYIPMHAGPRARTLPKRWTEHQIEWARLGMERVVELTRQSRAKGELPIACMVSDSYDPALEPENQPRPVELASHHDTRRSTGNTLCHAFRNLIAAVAEIDCRGARQTFRTAPTSKGASLPYLLTGMTLFTSHEPCLLCSMALLHSRVQTIIYALPADGAGGCGSVYDVHEDEGLNHKFEAWQFIGVEGLEAVEVDP